MSGRLDDSFKPSQTPDVFLDGIEHYTRGMLVRAIAIEWTPEDLNRLREAVSTLDAIGARVGRKFK